MAVVLAGFRREFLAVLRSLPTPETVGVEVIPRLDDLDETVRLQELNLRNVNTIVCSMTGILEHQRDVYGTMVEKVVSALRSPSPAPPLPTPGSDRETASTTPPEGNVPYLFADLSESPELEGFSAESRCALSDLAELAQLSTDFVTGLMDGRYRGIGVVTMRTLRDRLRDLAGDFVEVSARRYLLADLEALAST